MTNPLSSISAVDHIVEHPRVWTDRMSKAEWGDRIPHVERQSDGSDCWVIDGVKHPLLGRGSVGAFAADRNFTPRTWDEVPGAAWNAADRLTIMDGGSISYSVLYPTIAGLAGDTFARGEDAAFEIACVRAYNDFVIDEWASVSPRFVPQCIIPLWSPEEAAAEIERSVARGHKGVIVPPYPSKIGEHPHLNENVFDPIWRTCEKLGVPVCFHSGGNPELELVPYEGFSPAIQAACEGITRPASLMFSVANLLVSGILDRFPNLKVLFANTGLGWLGFILEAADHQFANFHLKEQHGYPLTPLELFRRQCYATGHYGEASVRHVCDYPGAANIMWSANLPMANSSWPDTEVSIEHSFRGVEPAVRSQVARDNAAALYRL
jgi:predicted TIM-barrel fold metal-dependent hydrolase